MGLPGLCEGETTTTVTEYGYCPNCDTERVELVMTTAGVLACCRCDAVNVFSNKKAYEERQEKREAKD